jgi:hypothetical protein
MAAISMPGGILVGAKGAGTAEDPYVVCFLPASARYIEAVTPHDTNALAATCDALWVGGAGTITVLTEGGSEETTSGVAAGTLLPVRATHVRLTGTSATLIQAWRY